MSRHDVGPQLNISRNSYLFPEVLTIRLIGFLYLLRGIAECGCHFYFLGMALSAGEG